MSDRSRPPDDGRHRSHGGGCEVSDANAPEEYRVGPGRPPKQFQWQPGQSGNPRGRKRTSGSRVPDLKAVLERALSKKVTLRQGEQERVVTMATAGIEHLVAQFAKGDRHARRDVMDLAQKLGVDITAGQRKAIERATDLTADDQALLDDYLQRRGGQRDHRSTDAGLPRSEQLGETNPGRKEHDKS